MFSKPSDEGERNTHSVSALLLVCLFCHSRKDMNPEFSADQILDVENVYFLHSGPD